MTTIEWIEKNRTYNNLDAREYHVKLFDEDLIPWYIDEFTTDTNKVLFILFIIIFPMFYLTLTVIISDNESEFMFGFILTTILTFINMVCYVIANR
jgi:hypothetical protein